MRSAFATNVFVGDFLQCTCCERKLRQCFACCWQFATYRNWVATKSYRCARFLGRFFLPVFLTVFFATFLTVFFLAFFAVFFFDAMIAPNRELGLVGFWSTLADRLQS